MNRLFFLLCLLAGSFVAFAQPKDETKTSLIGTWKFSKKTVINDYEQVFKNTQTYQTEYYTFNNDNTFDHVFLNKEGEWVKTLTGHWKTNRDKMHLKYDSLDFNLTIGYHFTNYDLVFDQDYNHVILTRDYFDFLELAAK